MVGYELLRPTCGVDGCDNLCNKIGFYKNGDHRLIHNGDLKIK